MQFEPIVAEFDQSLYVMDPKLRPHNNAKEDYDDDEGINASIYSVLNNHKNHKKTKKSTKSFQTIIVPIIISAIVFITILSLYDVVKHALLNYYARKALLDPKARNRKKNITRTLIANSQHLFSLIIFSLFCIFTTFIALYIYFVL